MRSQVDLVVATGPEVALQAVIGASRSIPIVFLAVQYDPISGGYVNSLAIQGATLQEYFIASLNCGKAARNTSPSLSAAVAIGGPVYAGSADQFSAADAVAKSMPLQLRPLKLEKPPYDFGVAFQTMANDGAQMVLVLSSPFFVEYHKEITAGAISIVYQLCSSSRLTW